MATNFVRRSSDSGGSGALKVHPAVLVFPGWEVGEESAA